VQWLYGEYPVTGFALVSLCGFSLAFTDPRADNITFSSAVGAFGFFNYLRLKD